MSRNIKPRITRSFAGIIVLGLGLFIASQSFAATPVAKSSDAGHATQTNCVILERMGTVGQLESRMLSLGVRGSEFQFIEGRLPQGVSFHNKLTEHDVRNLQANGADVVILDADYMPDSLMSAREGCLKAALRKAPAPLATSQVEIASSPMGSDIEIDGKFVGSTPSLVKVSSGEHTVKLTKDGYEVWQRTLTTMSSNVRISPDLQPVAAAAASTASTDESPATLDTVAASQY